MPSLDSAARRGRALSLVFDHPLNLSRLVELRHFGGLTLEEAGQVLGISTTSAWRDWNTARAWLFDALSTGS